jgi:Zinc carboxypeptidase
VPILALKVTKDARTTPDGQRPAVLYSSNQHAREWITSETNRRLAHLFVDNYTYPTDATEATSTSGDVEGEAADLTKGDLTRIVNTTELWFVVAANPDGYDFTFTEGNRLWRKNLRDNNKDGKITQLDGVDPNRNFPTKWGYDNEGSSDDPASETFRGTAPTR